MTKMILVKNIKLITLHTTYKKDEPQQKVLQNTFSAKTKLHFASGKKEKK